MNRYRTATTDTIQSTRRTLIAGLANPRLNETNRANITGWIAEADAELMRRAAVVVVAPAKVRAPMMTEQEKWNCWS